ncbi:MAG: hypothetical protein ABFD63_09745 [Smithella sp.]
MPMTGREFTPDSVTVVSGFSMWILVAAFSTLFSRASWWNKSSLE